MVHGTISHYYRIAGNFGWSKFWRMTQILCFDEFNFGVKCLAHVFTAIEKADFGEFYFDECLTIRQIRQSFLSPKLPAIRYVHYESHYYARVSHYCCLLLLIKFTCGIKNPSLVLRPNLFLYGSQRVWQLA